jgi:hypothetical protein
MIRKFTSTVYVVKLQENTKSHEKENITELKKYKSTNLCNKDLREDLQNSIIHRD